MLYNDWFDSGIVGKYLMKAGMGSVDHLEVLSNTGRSLECTVSDDRLIMLLLVVVVFVARKTWHNIFHKHTRKE